MSILYYNLVVIIIRGLLNKVHFIASFLPPIQIFEGNRDSLGSSSV